MNDPEFERTVELASEQLTGTMIEKSVSSPNKISAIKHVLARGGLIECIDPGWAEVTGVGKKYVVGPNHQRYAEFLEFAKNVTFIPIRRRVRKAA